MALESKKKKAFVLSPVGTTNLVFYFLISFPSGSVGALVLPYVGASHGVALLSIPKTLQGGTCRRENTRTLSKLSALRRSRECLCEEVPVPGRRTEGWEAIQVTGWERGAARQPRETKGEAGMAVTGPSNGPK